MIVSYIILVILIFSPLLVVTVIAFIIVLVIYLDYKQMDRKKLQKRINNEISDKFDDRTVYDRLLYLLDYMEDEHYHQGIQTYATSNCFIPLSVLKNVYKKMYNATDRIGFLLISLTEITKTK